MSLFLSVCAVEELSFGLLFSTGVLDRQEETIVFGGVVHEIVWKEEVLL